jgi:signal transduction histidine kinase
MRLSLRRRLFLMAVLVVGIAVGVLALLSSQVTTVELQRFVTAEPGKQVEEVVEKDVEGTLGSIRRSLALAAAAAAAVALLVTAALARRLLGPIEALTEAARRMGSGDLAQRVEVRSEDEVGELARAFNAMADGLERLERLRRNLVSDVAHELRTPLTNLRCQLEALQDGLVEPGAEVVDSLHEEALLLQRLVEDLQELTLAEAGQLRLSVRPVEVRRELERALAALEAQVRAGGLGAGLEVQEGLPAALADPERLQQVLRNLLQNAVAHTPAGGRIELGARRAGAEVEVFVRDTGEGIAAEHLPNVFERFYRVDPARGRATGGAGLGLAIVRQLVRAQGGRVWAESRLGQGSSFFFSLPAAGG